MSSYHHALGELRRELRDASNTIQRLEEEFRIEMRRIARLEAKVELLEEIKIAPVDRGPRPQKAVIDLVESSPGITQRAIVERLRDSIESLSTNRGQTLRSTIKNAVAAGKIVMRDGRFYPVIVDETRSDTEAVALWRGERTN